MMTEVDVSEVQIDPNRSVASYTKHHRRHSSLWIPSARPVLSNPTPVIKETTKSLLERFRSWVPRRFRRSEESKTGTRVIVPNHMYEMPRYKNPNRRKFRTNKISTTKYNAFTFIPKNLFEQFHRAANIYFISIVILNMIIQAFGRYISLIPVIFVLTVTAAKDAYEDYRRFRSDRKINHATCRVWDNETERYRKMEWKNVLVGDFVHLSSNEIIPADILLIRSSDPTGICYVETSNLDGETSLKQREVIQSMADYHAAAAAKSHKRTLSTMSTKEIPFSPREFRSKIEVELPNNQIHQFSGYVIHEDGAKEACSKNNVLLRGCEVRNTDFVEGIVIYAGYDTKAMLNNSGPRYKRSALEKRVNKDILWCVVTLLLLCAIGAIVNSTFLKGFDDVTRVPFLTYTGEEAGDVNIDWDCFVNFFSFIIVLQVLIPISLYVSIEIIKLGQIYFISKDIDLYYEPMDKPIECRALNIPEELGQIEYVLSDKTGTLTENKMIFRRCYAGGLDCGAADDGQGGFEITVDHKFRKNVALSLDRHLEIGSAKTANEEDDDVYHFLVNMALCNTVVVNAVPHQDNLDECGASLVQEEVVDEGPGEPDRPSSSSPTIEPDLIYLESPTLTPKETPVTTPCEDGPKSIVEAKPKKKHVSFFKKLKKTDDDETSNSGSEGYASGGNNSSNEDTPKPKRDKKKLEQSDSNRSSGLGFKHKIKDFNPLFKSVQAPKIAIFRFRKSSKKDDEHWKEIVANPIYEAESPDELALVHAAKVYGAELKQRYLNQITLQMNPSSTLKKFKLLHTFSFDSDRKRMSVVVKDVSGPVSTVDVYVKGADSSILCVLSRDFKDSARGQDLMYTAQQRTSYYSTLGLRTLWLAKRTISAEKFEQWKREYENGDTLTEGRDAALQHFVESVECEFELLGVTAIEDRLQDGVPECIRDLRRGGLKVWVLTGDKTETAINIAHASNLFSPDTELIHLHARNERDTSEMLDCMIENIDNKMQADEGKRSLEEMDFGLVVNGDSLTSCLKTEHLDKFLKLIKICRSVLCCRSTPLQKAALVKLVKKRLGGKVLAIGDGANDVSMIQSADVGIGISGHEGMQAVMASDYALARFRFLTRLLFMFVFTIFWFQIFTGFSSQVPIDQLYLMVYNFLFTSIPCLIFGMMEQDAPASMLLDNPELYTKGGIKMMYTWWSFWLNMIDALWQSAVVYFVAHLTYNNSEVDLWPFGLLLVTQLVCTQTFQLAMQVKFWNVIILISMLLSIVVFFCFALIYNVVVVPAYEAKYPPYMVAQTTMDDRRFWFALLLSMVIALLPRLLLKLGNNLIRPSAITKKKLEKMRKVK
ncbi:hypothetical protein QR680_012266 [Steinernema hermaphroditum]|uniref:Phospholipid-transporting ATPase n=1 Tax=Steinernema hermaphroditum TaxID=289476 RepID=A0AA39I1G8_9BILA|nr:hypothetical protein QR680_012266 [Steinernema hermaphroditum]